MTYPPPSTLGGVPSERRHLLNIISNSTSAGGLAKILLEAYKLTISQKRDLAAIAAQHDITIRRDAQDHEKVMTALLNGYAQQAAQIAVVERVVMLCSEAGDHEMAHSIVSQLMVVLRKSPVQEALELRRR